jgi:hypothetical protein
MDWAIAHFGQIHLPLPPVTIIVNNRHHQENPTIHTFSVDAAAAVDASIFFLLFARELLLYGWTRVVAGWVP